MGQEQQAKQKLSAMHRARSTVHGTYSSGAGGETGVGCGEGSTEVTGVRRQGQAVGRELMRSEELARGRGGGEGGGQGGDEVIQWLQQCHYS